MPALRTWPRQHRRDSRSAGQPHRTPVEQLRSARRRCIRFRLPSLRGRVRGLRSVGFHSRRGRRGNRRARRRRRRGGPRRVRRPLGRWRAQVHACRGGGRRSGYRSRPPPARRESPTSLGMASTDRVGQTDGGCPRALLVGRPQRRRPVRSDPRMGSRRTWRASARSSPRRALRGVGRPNPQTPRLRQPSTLPEL